MHAIQETEITTNGTRLHVVTAGAGSPALLLHGFPHTWRVWQAVIPALAERHLVVAPDLRGLGASEHAADGYDARNQAQDLLGVLDAIGAESAAVIGLDAGGPPAFMLALEHPDRVSRLALIETTIGLLPGAEDFFRGGPPWWFGFHAVPGLAESVLQGHEADYVDFFLRAGTADGQGVQPAVRDAFVEAYRGRDALRSAFEHYRAMPENAAQIAAATAGRRLPMPTLAIGGRVVGEVTARQLAPVADDLSAVLLRDSGHIVPLDRPAELLAVLDPFLDTAAQG